MYCFSFRKILFRVVLPLGGVVLLWASVMAWVTPSPLFPEGNYATVMTARQGELLGARLSPDGQWRFPVCDTAPDKVARALVMYEDHRFYAHIGLDPVALLRAVWQNMRNRRVVSGGSTLTMQLARLSYGAGERTLWRKLLEMNRAFFLEWRYSKAELLALYCSHAPYGGNVIGVETASWRYWGRPSASLSWAEAATLAVLPNAPSLIHPGRNRELLLHKRNQLLARLRDAGALTDVDYSLALLEPLPDKPLPLPSEAPHLLEVLCKRAPGRYTQTTLDAPLQHRVQALVNQYAREYTASQVHNVAVVVAEVESGRVIAYAGNASFVADEASHNQVDVVPAPRSSGSILKPLLYAAALQEGLIAPSSLLADVPTELNGFRPQNYSRCYSGAIPAHQVLSQSLNVPMVRLLQQYGVGRFLSLLRQMGVTTLPYDEDHYGATLILGGGEVSLWDLVGMYGSMARVLNHYMPLNGQYAPEDVHPLTFLPVSVAGTQTSPLSAAAIWQSFEAMAEVNRPKEESAWWQFRSMKRVAWKTGTSYGSRDAWSVGVTPNYVVGVWVGNADGEGRSGLTGVGYAAPVLFSVLSLLPDGGWFAPPYDEMVQERLCRRSGYKASLSCPEVDSVWVHQQASVSLPQCRYHRLVHLTPDGRYRVDSSCQPVASMQSRMWFVLPPTMAWYYKQVHLDYEVLPPWLPGCGGEESTPLQIIYPTAGAHIVGVRGMDGRPNPIVLHAVHQQSEVSLFWHMDHTYLGTTSGNKHEWAWYPTVGKHTLTVMDSDGHQSQVTFQVK